MRHYVQPTPTTCGPTCVAMILEKSPNKLIKTYRMDVRATNAWELKIPLKANGVTVSGPFKKREKFPDEAIVMLRPKRKYAGMYPWGHWVVYKRGFIYDPLKHKRTRLESYERYMKRNNYIFTSFMEIGERI